MTDLLRGEWGFRGFVVSDYTGDEEMIAHGFAKDGRDAARQFYETLFVDLSDGKVDCIRRLYGKNFLVDESLWQGKAPGKPFGLEGRGRPLQFRLLHVIECADSGDIKRENVWLDLASIIRQLPQD